MSEQIHTKFREEFLLFIEELKHSGITQKLYNSTTPEESISIWDKYSSENQELFTKIKNWAAERDAYFNTCEAFALFSDEEQLDCILEICLILIIVNDESILCEEDINNEFGEELYFLLNQSSNKVIKAVAEYIDCNGYETLSKENIFDFYLDE